MCGIYSKTVLPSRRGQVDSIGPEAQELGSQRCQAESNWWNSLGSQAGVRRAVSTLLVKALCPACRLVGSV